MTKIRRRRDHKTSRRHESSFELSEYEMLGLDVFYPSRYHFDDWGDYVPVCPPIEILVVDSIANKDMVDEHFLHIVRDGKSLCVYESVLLSQERLHLLLARLGSLSAWNRGICISTCFSNNEGGVKYELMKSSIKEILLFCQKRHLLRGFVVGSEDEPGHATFICDILCRHANPNFKQLCIAAHRPAHYKTWSTEEQDQFGQDLLALEKFLATTTTLEKMFVGLAHDDMVVPIMRGIAANRSIKKLRLQWNIMEIKAESASLILPSITDHPTISHMELEGGLDNTTSGGYTIKPDLINFVAKIGESAALKYLRLGGALGGVEAMPWVVSTLPDVSSLRVLDISAGYLGGEKTENFRSALCRWITWKPRLFIKFSGHELWKLDQQKPRRVPCEVQKQQLALALYQVGGPVGVVAPEQTSLWPLVLARANRLIQDPKRSANAIYTLLQGSGISALLRGAKQSQGPKKLRLDKLHRRQNANAKNRSKYVIVRLAKRGLTLEVVCHRDQYQKYKRSCGRDDLQEVDSVLEAKRIFISVERTEYAHDDLLQDFFGTVETLSVARFILQNGAPVLSVEEEMEMNRIKLCDWIVKNCVDPTSNQPSLDLSTIESTLCNLLADDDREEDLLLDITAPKFHLLCTKMVLKLANVFPIKMADKTVMLCFPPHEQCFVEALLAELEVANVFVKVDDPQSVNIRASLNKEQTKALFSKVRRMPDVVIKMVDDDSESGATRNITTQSKEYSF